MDKKEVPWSGRGHNYTKTEIDAVIEAMTQADPLTQGTHLAEFEKKFKHYLGIEHAFAVANCTNALDLAALLSGLRNGDEVIIPAHTFCATAIPFARTGAKIVWADIDPQTLVVSAETIRPLITEKTKVVVVVHLYGLMSDMESIMDLAKEFGLLIVEDCAQAIGADINGEKAGTFGDFACFSFHGAKNMSTLGEGGMLVVRSNELASPVLGLRHNGSRPYRGERDQYWKPAMSNVESDIDGIWPYNFCLGEIACAVGSTLLDRIDEMNAQRIARATRFIKAMRDYPEIVFQKMPTGFKHIYHLLAARFDSPKYGKSNDDFIRLMSTKYRVKVIVQYYPLYRYPLFIKNGFGEANCPNSDAFYDNMVSFPFHLWMTETDFDYMIHATRAALDELRR
ncbi:DegT/DnrJ/EryC1/StrS family aminotransferase [candidate division KSB1 bacterium]|nr:DegT/DnrJ/EryC1/StrS family aminotransferase [candidate division KSB1 bacterium]